MQQPRRRYRFPPAARVRKKREYERVFARGVRVRDDLIKLVVAPRDSPELPSRLGTAVSRRIGGAAARNRVRRRLREAFRLESAELPRGLDVVCIPLPLVPEPPLPELRRSLRELIERAAARLLRRSAAARRPRPAEGG
ncbi:MAG: hypothetical protein KatS3mg102_1370 [Planctomycetota bacterium]|nr:MAG: hypothetical protein KatS3mg102_1370 [Planctomycetota bacterium]